MFQRISFVALLLLHGFVLPTLRADEPVGRPLVVAVGIDKYQDAQIKPRKHAESDARAIVEWFLAKENLGAEPDRVKLLLGSGPVEGAKYPTEKATKNNILNALQWLDKSAKKDDLVIFAIFGEGAPLGERSCYFAVDSTFKNRAKDAISSSDIDHIVEKMPSQRFVAMVDVNFLGFNPGKEKMPEANSQNFYREFLGLGDQTKEHTPSRVIFMAGSALKPSLDLEKRGIFAQALLDGLSGKADAEGYEADGNVMVTELAKHVRTAVPELARAQGTTKEQKEQKAGVFESQASDFIIGYNAKAHAKALDRLKKFDALTQTQKLDKKLAEEGHNALTHMPKLTPRHWLA